jgi:hypothetical protein
MKRHPAKAFATGVLLVPPNRCLVIRRETVVCSSLRGEATQESGRRNPPVPSRFAGLRAWHLLQGKAADLVVLERDLFAIPPSEIYRDPGFKVSSGG